MPKLGGRGPDGITGAFSKPPPLMTGPRIQEELAMVSQQDKTPYFKSAPKYVPQLLPITDIDRKSAGLMFSETNLD